VYKARSESKQTINETPDLLKSKAVRACTVSLWNMATAGWVVACESSAQ